MYNPFFILPFHSIISFPSFLSSFCNSEIFILSLNFLLYFFLFHSNNRISSLISSTVHIPSRISHEIANEWNTNRAIQLFRRQFARTNTCITTDNDNLPIQKKKTLHIFILLAFRFVFSLVTSRTVLSPLCHRADTKLIFFHSPNQASFLSTSSTTFS